MIDHIRQRHRGETRVACAYFFFDSRNAETERSLHDKMLRSLIRQLSRQSGGVPAPLMQLYDGGYEKPPLTSLQQTLHTIIAGFERTYIILDALDECTDRSRLLSWIVDLLQKNLDQLRILFSSRREHDIEQHFENVSSISRLSLAGPSIDADIESYVDAMISEISRWNEGTRTRVKHVLMEGADGM